MRIRAGFLGLMLSTNAWAQGVQTAQPPPEFTSGYRLPVTRAPLPRAAIFETIDVLVLAIVLALAAWFLLKRRSRTEIRVLSIFSVAYFGFYKLGCVCSVGSVQNVVYAVTHGDYALPLSVAAFFVLPLVAALFWGRVFCGAACPLGAIQDLLLLRPQKLPGWLSGALGTLPYVYLGTAVLFASTGTAFVICDYDPFISVFRLSGHAPIIALTAGMLAVSVFVGRPYCRFLCPYGVVLRWCSSLAKHRVKVSPEECIACHLCANACPYGSIRPPTAEEPFNPGQARALVASRLALIPVLVIGFGLIGRFAAPSLASTDSRVVRAQDLRAEELNPKLAPTLATTAWRQHRHTNAEAYVQAGTVERQFSIGTALLGAWIGLVLGLRLLNLTSRERRKEYEVDPADCVACGRCYAACPVPNRERFAQLDNILGGAA